MNEITLENYRCFREKQTARMAPLTLLVGENSTGKTSFMAMIRALLDVGVSWRVPDFKDQPYDLGSFDEIAHFRGGRGGRANTFEAAFSRIEAGNDTPHRFEVAFAKKGTTPVPVRRRFARDDASWEEHFGVRGLYLLRFKTHRGVWEWRVPERLMPLYGIDENMAMPPTLYFLRVPVSEDNQDKDINIEPLDGSPPFISEDRDKLKEFVFGFRFAGQRPFASAPVRSKPRRTYDPARTTPDPEGDYVPMYLASMFFENKRAWTTLKRRLEAFGRVAGLFDEMSIKPLGKRDSEPFQVQVRKSGGRSKGPWRNLIDMGYGVSQALPVITELLRPDGPEMFLLQQPEVHLHPSAQAALGSLLCQVAGFDRQLVVETHSDHLLDRVRMEVRDRTLEPDDVSILFFERGDLDVRIHSLRIDEEGNIVDAPRGYRRFFMEETQRSLGL